MADVNLVEETKESNGFDSVGDFDGMTTLIRAKVSMLKDLMAPRNDACDDNDIGLTQSGAYGATLLMDEFDEFLKKAVDFVYAEKEKYKDAILLARPSQPEITAAELINDARNNFTGIDKLLPLKEYIEHLPETLEGILTLGMKHAGYKSIMRDRGIDTTMRYLAATIVSLQDKLAESEIKVQEVDLKPKEPAPETGTPDQSADTLTEDDVISFRAKLMMIKNLFEREDVDLEQNGFTMTLDGAHGMVNILGECDDMLDKLFYYHP